MKILSVKTRQVYDYVPNGSRSKCPECSHTRTKKDDKCMAWDKDKERGFCHNCQGIFFKYREPKEYIVPEWTNHTQLTDKAVKWFEGRMIAQGVLNKMKVYSDNIYMTQNGKEIEVICFPYMADGKLINIKYRGFDKSFQMVKGAELIFYNIDSLSKYEEIIITEGEIDALTLIQAGFENTLSVPNGATRNLDFLNPETFEKIKKIFIAVDQDAKGTELKNELIKRLGAEKCFIVPFKDCKDANEYLIKYGPDIKEVLNNAIPAPVTEEQDFLIAKPANEWIEEANKRPIPKMLFSELWHEGELCILFATSGNGKSILSVQIADAITCGLPLAGFKMEASPQIVLYFDFELSDKQFEGRYSDKFKNHYKFNEKFIRIEINPDADIPEKMTVEEFLINSIEVRITKLNARILIIDNITYLSNDPEKAKDALPLLKKLKDLKKRYDLSILALTHTPKRDESRPIGKNDLFGSSMIYNFCDSAFTIGKSSHDESLRYIKQIKERFKAKIYDSDNVIVCQIEKPYNCTQFTFIGFGKESDYLKTISETEKQVMKEMIPQRSREGKSSREIAKEFNITRYKVEKILKSQIDEKCTF